MLVAGPADVQGLAAQNLRALAGEHVHFYTERAPCALHDAPGAPPGFVVLGARGAGTSSLYGALAAHESVYPATCKEPGFLLHRAPRKPGGAGALAWYDAAAAAVPPPPFRARARARVCSSRG